ncbi:probable pectate lyase 22 [Miscanthus floridulus]|uniref:probable pectate lyase 22 n=1 Tax=Miscanthus floridulus TaxID=154761 RepID=UPI00345A8F4E
MAFLMLCFTSFLHLPIASPLPIDAATASGQDPEQVVQDVVRSVNMPSLHRRRMVGECGSGNPVDDCWRCDPSWADNRQRLADCVVGFGRAAIGGKNGKTYVVTDPSDDADPASPAPGTLRYGVIQQKPLWITFARDMTIRPKQDLLVASYKTVDGRGAGVVVGDGGACFVLRNVSNVIIHGLTIRGCKPAPALSPSAESEGDGITVFRATNVWVDHCTLEACADGLIDVTDGSTNVTLCRFGLFHVINNDYINWEIYAIGGSASPTIMSHGNRFLADKAKEFSSVTKREAAPDTEWSKWTWITEDDTMLNGAFFTSSGTPGPEVKAPGFAKPSSFVPAITASVGVLSCKEGSLC